MEMDVKKSPGSLLALVAICVAMGVTAGVPGTKATGTPAIAPDTLTRDREPVIVLGRDLPAFLGVSLDEIFVYAHAAGEWRPIPFQIDEVTEAGGYAMVEDGLLDANDELVILARDLGDQVPPWEWIGDADARSHPRYEILTVDGTDTTRRAWSYVYRSDELRSNLSQDNVVYDPETHRVETETYTALLSPDAGLESLMLNGSGVDILDRNKFRVNFGPFVITEQDLGLVIVPVADGVVRSIVEARLSEDDEAGSFYRLRLLAYPSLFQIRLSTDLSGILPTLFPVNNVRVSMDFNVNAAGMTYYSANVMRGVTIDGRPDDVPTQPISRWQQISGATGSLVLVADPSPIGGSQSTYYKDDATVDPEDTGDQMSYGDFGFQVGGLIRTAFAVRSDLYVLPPDQPNVGAVYEGYYSTSLASRPQVQEIQPSPTPTTVITPEATATGTSTPEATPTITPPVTLTNTPTDVATVTSTVTPSKTSTATATVSVTATPTTTPVPTQTPTLTLSGTPTSTATLPPTSTSTPAPTPSTPVTHTSTVVSTAPSTPTSTSVPTGTSTPSTTLTPASVHYYLPMVVRNAR